MAQPAPLDPCQGFVVTSRGKVFFLHHGARPLLADKGLREWPWRVPWHSGEKTEGCRPEPPQKQCTPTLHPEQISLPRCD